MSHLMDLPNVEGFEFTGITHGEESVSCVVVKDSMGRHFVKKKSDNSPCFAELVSWIRN